MSQFSLTSNGKKVIVTEANHTIRGISGPYYYVDCPDCDGKGQVEKQVAVDDTDMFECERCYGKGEVRIDLDGCDDCDGKGFNWDNRGGDDFKVPCRVCDCSGYQFENGVLK